MNPAGILLDTGPLVALLSAKDGQHERAKQLFATCTAPFRTCEAVIAEACFLMRQIDPEGPAEVVALARKGLFEIALGVEDEWAELEVLLRKYKTRRISLAGACLIRCAERHGEPRILTFDADFRIYRWSRNKPFQMM
ncbi:MAG: PIN domain-containing protein [Vicinamibacterales bacterium]